MNLSIHIPEPVLWVVGTLLVIIVAELILRQLFPGN